mgnify:CR=1 FL=1|tara:strand:+ start:8400 stop:9554 length:1155 start_codon:yes stop_codon:yes gene_type:complete
MKNNVHIYPTIMTHESRIYKIAETISSLNYFDNIFLLGINNGKLKKQESFKKNISIYRLNMNETQWLKTGIHVKTMNVLRLTFHTFKFLKQKNPEVVHAHNLASLPVCVFYKFFNNKTKIVYDTHEIEARRNGWSILVQFIAKNIETILIKFCEVTVVVNDKFKDVYKKWYNIEAIRIFNTPFYNKLPKNNYLREKYSIKDNTPIFAYVGVLDDSRGVDHYLDFALKTNMDICFVFIGRIIENEKNIKSIANQTDKIFIHEAVPLDVLYKILRSADFSLQALHLRKSIAMNNLLGLGNKFFESAMAGLPMIGGGFEVQSGFISEYNLGVVIKEGNEFESITNAVGEITKMDYLILQDNCFKFFAKYNWDNESKKIKEYYYNSLI